METFETILAEYGLAWNPYFAQDSFQKKLRKGMEWWAESQKDQGCLVDRNIHFKSAMVNCFREGRFVVFDSEIFTKRTAITYNDSEAYPEWFYGTLFLTLAVRGERIYYEALGNNYPVKQISENKLTSGQPIDKVFLERLGIEPVEMVFQPEQAIARAKQEIAKERGNFSEKIRNNKTLALLMEQIETTLRAENEFYFDIIEKI